MNKLFVAIGVALIVIGVAGGLYLGGWLCFIGGIVQVVEAIKAEPVSSWGIAIGLFRVVIAAFVGWVTFLLCSIVGGAFIKVAK